MVELFLTVEGYRVCTAAHGLDALDCIREMAPCLIFLDVMMPVMDGVTFAQRLRRDSNPTIAQTPIVLLTAIPQPASVQRLIGAVGVIPKPITFDAIHAAVEKYCRPR